MTAQNKTTIKSYFETGDRPTQAQFADLIDSYIDSMGSSKDARLVVVSGVNGDALREVTSTGFVKLSAGTVNTQTSIFLTDLSAIPTNTALVNSSAAAGTPAALTINTNSLLGRGVGNIASLTLGPEFTVSANNTLNVAAVSAASQAAQEAGSATDVYTSPGRQQFHQSAAKAWFNFNGTGTVALRASYNISSITDNGMGDYTANFATAFSGANAYNGMVTCGEGGNAGTDLVARSPVTDNPAATTWRMKTLNAAQSAQVDAPWVNGVFFGDQ